MTNRLKSSEGLRFIRQSSLNRATIRDLVRYESSSTPAGTDFPAAERFSLPRSPWRLSEARIQPLLQQRRSLRKYAVTPLKLIDLSFILWSCQGISAKTGKHSLRTVPSAGAVYPVKTYLSIQNVEGLGAGLYYFDPHSFELALVTEGNPAEKLASACLDQRFMVQAALSFIWTGTPRKSMSKYGERGMRYLFLDAAHICQSALMAAEAVNCGGCPVAAFYDDDINSILGIDGIEEISLYLAAIGAKT